MTPEQNLMNAVLLQAAQDYRHCRLTINKAKGRISCAEKKLKEIEDFFASGEAQKFTKADTDVILEKLKSESLSEAKRLYHESKYRKKKDEFRNKVGE